MSRSICVLIVLVLFAVASHAEPPVEPKGVKPDLGVLKLEEAKADNAAMKKRHEALSVQASGLLAKIGEQAQVIALLEIEVKRLSPELEAARKGK